MKTRHCLALLGAALAGCGNEYVCPDPIGKIVRDDCSEYKTRYESLKVQLGFSIGHLGVTFGAGHEKLRDPSELLQLLMQQTMALCKDFNTCRVPSEDYRRRREESDRKFTAITAITQQLSSDLDADSKRRLVAKLIDVITAPSGGGGMSPGGRVGRAAPRFGPGFFRDAVRVWFGSRFAPPRPSLPAGVPVVAEWSPSRGRECSVCIDGKRPKYWRPESHLNLKLWGKVEADDRIYVSLSAPQLEASEQVRPSRGEPAGSAHFTFRKACLGAAMTATISYRPGSTGQKHTIGTVSLDPRPLLGKGYVAYMPDPVRADVVEYERPWLVFYSQLKPDARVTVRCEHNGKSDGTVLTGHGETGYHDPRHLQRHHVPLPVRIPLKGGKERRDWATERSGVAGEKAPTDRLPSEAAGLWVCRVSFNGRPARRMELRLKDGGAIVAAPPSARIAPPWWEVRTERLANDVERRREQELQAEDAKGEGCAERPAEE